MEMAEKIRMTRRELYAKRRKKRVMKRIGYGVAGVMAVLAIFVSHKRSR